jgi:hypothetical protein
MMSFIALANEHYQATLSPRQFVNCQTIDDMAALAAGQRA